VHRLSIVVTATDNFVHLEETLLSVLEHRPDDCEVVVVHDGSYEDPYDLSADEVFLVCVDPSQSWIERVVTGCQMATSNVVHVLGCGALVEEGWTRSAATHFVDDRVGSVVPVIASRDEPTRVESVGVVYRGCGWRRCLAAGRKLGKLRAKRLRPLGPSLRGGFYRREPLLAAADHLELLGDRLADVDIGLSLRGAGYKTTVEPDSRIYDLDQLVEDESPFRLGQQSERLFWRSIGKLGWKKSLAMYPLILLADVVRIANKLDGFWRLCGRLTAAMEVIRYRHHYRQIAKIASPSVNEGAADDDLGVVRYEPLSEIENSISEQETGVERAADSITANRLAG